MPVIQRQAAALSVIQTKVSRNEKRRENKFTQFTRLTQFPWFALLRLNEPGKLGKLSKPCKPGRCQKTDDKKCLTNGLSSTIVDWIF